MTGVLFIQVGDNGDNGAQLLRWEDRLRQTLQPPHHWVFSQISRLSGGVKFLVDMRQDLLVRFIHDIFMFWISHKENSMSSVYTGLHLSYFFPFSCESVFEKHITFKYLLRGEKITMQQGAHYISKLCLLYIFMQCNCLLNIMTSHRKNTVEYSLDWPHFC